MSKTAKSYRYRNNSPNSTLDAIKRMRQLSRAVTYETVAANCHALDVWAASRGYSANPGKSGALTLAQDKRVQYYKSKYCGVTCYYIVLEGLEYIWTLRGE
jgi:hypothetical protein